MTKDEALKLALEALENNRQTHHYCEDTWYSCPKHEDGCANESEGNECNCGVDEANAEIDKAITAIKEVLAQPEQEPEWYHGIDVYGCNRFYHKTEDRTSEFNTPLYTTPPKRKWVGLTQDELNMIGDSMRTWNSWTITDVYFAIEAKLKQKNTRGQE